MSREKSNQLILLADDDPDDRVLFKDAIEQADLNIELKTLDGGVELMDHLMDPANPLPYLIFLDLNMPKKNGFECLDEIRKNERLKNLCVIIYSTSSQFKDILDTLNKGANLYFTKPSTFQELVSRLRKVLSLNWDEYQPKMSIEKFVLSDGMGF
jgi:DNA-binding response OmpR family regulator